MFAIAHGRDGMLIQAVRAEPAHAHITAFLQDMAAHADFLRPYEFLERALVRHGGRQALLARLGEEVVSAVLATPVVDETQHPIEGHLVAHGDEDHMTFPW